MEDLINTLSGNMHVSQESYDLKALQEYLAATIALPSALSPATGFRPLPPSRSTSSTRKHLHTSLLPEPGAPFPSPGISSTSAFWNSADDVSMTTPLGRPAGIRRTSSYGFGGSKEYSTQQTVNDNCAAFQNDAFAPLYAQPNGDRWAGFHAPKTNPWVGFGGPSSTFGRITEQQIPQAQMDPPESGQSLEEQEAQDEEWADQSMDEIEDEDSVEDAMGYDVAEENILQPGYAHHERGRRKD